MICKRCVLPSSFPGVQFDDVGICSFCRADSESDIEKRRFGLERRLEDLFRTVRGRGDYDCLVAYSGGKDSSYTLWLLATRYKLRCLAITVDNGFISEQAIVNCRVLSDAFGIDHVLYKPAFGFMKTMYRESLKGGMHPNAAVKRASAVCNACINLINNHMVKTALQQDIPIVAGGYIGGQVPKDAALVEFRLEAMQQARAHGLSRFAERFGQDNAARYFGLGALDATRALRDRVFITNPMLVLQAREDAIIDKLSAYGWQRPTDTGRHSSNCRLNDLGIYMHQKQHGFHPYVAELAEQVRRGLMPRGEALERLADKPNRDHLKPIAERLDLHDLPG